MNYNNLLTKTEAEGTYNYAFDTGLLLKGDGLKATVVSWGLDSVLDSMECAE